MIDLTNPKHTAMFKINHATANLAHDLKENFQGMRTFSTNRWDHVDPEVQNAVNNVTYAIKHLMDLTNKRLEEFENEHKTTG